MAGPAAWPFPKAACSMTDTTNVSTKTMNTTVLHLRSSAGFYGAEQVILNLARELTELGCTTHIVCINNTKNPHLELMEAATKANLPAVAVDCRGFFDRQTIKRIREIIRAKKIDVIHCHDYKSCLFGLLAASRLKVGKVATNHLWTRSNLRLRVYATIEGLLYNRFDKVVAVSEDIEKECRPFILRKDKLTVIPNGIDLRRFALDNSAQDRRSTRAKLGFAEHDLVIGNIARLSIEKEQAVLLRAFKMLSGLSKNRSFKLLIAGEGEEENNLRTLAETLGIRNQCVFAGFRTDIPQLLNAIDVYVQSSRREGLPMIILEAMAARAAIVSTRAGGIPAAITDGEQGRLVDIGDADQLTRVLDEVLSNPDERKKLAQRARHRVEKQFSADAMADRYVAIYREITGN
jgi:glycosyltransferase involved in cell wall biosynthesis